MATAQQVEPFQENIFRRISEYPWDADTEFQSGLSSILGSTSDPARTEHLTARAQCFYFARKNGTHVDFDAYTVWLAGEGALGENVASTQPNGTAEVGHTASPTNGDSISQPAGGMADAPKPASFAEICDMIAEGKPIPGIKDIPDTILEGQASGKSASARVKPWEKSTAGSGNEVSWLDRR
ncbi:hypothetical protein B0A48_15587 [Cryoendolithus antarcticus]|uniref:Uncharacterized protein n=1 Tax=Cryoendolithus antarcticus TaxID=1507870 RepID=A0A1V8SGM9_9PEZI|nr:hypothetical protein B0A48_15587 [Cryoendolithus antarcticus]